MISSLATPATAFNRNMFTNRRERATPVYGVMLHTTGSGLPKKAPTNEGSLAAAVDHYTGSGGPHYVIGWDGTIVACVADEQIRGAHAGMAETEFRNAYTNGSWVNGVSEAGVELWKKKWPGLSSPLELIPTRNFNNINDLWIGIEMIPVTPGGSTFWAEPYKAGARFTKAQHKSARALVHDIAKRHSLPIGWAKKGSPRLLGHSDIDPLDRDSPVVPLWDPGDSIGFLDIDYIRKNGSEFLIAGGAAILLGLWASKHFT